MAAKIGFNILGDSPNLDRNKLTAVVDRLHAPWHLVMNNLELAKELSQKAKVAYRWTPADDAPLSHYPSADAFVDFALREFGGARLYAVVSNEAGEYDELLNRTCEIIEYGCPRGLHVAVLGLPSGTPSDTQSWKRPAMRRLLELCNQYRDKVVVLLHEYFCGVVTSGFIGGEPGFIQPEVWPRKLTDVAQWHCGRYQFLLEACDQLAIAAPRILISEHGADDMSDVKFWTQRLTVTPPYLNIRSWKSLWNQWRIWWPRWDSQRAYFEQLKYANDVIYENPAIEGQLIFAWTSPDAKWEAFDVSQANELHEMLITSASETLAPARKYEPGKDYVYTGANSFNIRNLPSTAITTVVKGQLKKDDRVRFTNVDAVEADGHVWQQGTVYKEGNLEITGWLAVGIIPLEEKQDAPPDEPPAPLPLFTRAELVRLAELDAQIATLTAERAAIWTKAADKAAA